MVSLYTPCEWEAKDFDNNEPHIFHDPVCLPQDQVKNTAVNKILGDYKHIVTTSKTSMRNAPAYFSHKTSEKKNLKILKLIIIF